MTRLVMGGPSCNALVLFSVGSLAFKNKQESNNLVQRRRRLTEPHSALRSLLPVSGLSLPLVAYRWKAYHASVSNPTPLLLPIAPIKVRGSQNIKINYRTWR